MANNANAQAMNNNISAITQETTVLCDTLASMQQQMANLLAQQQ